MSRPRYSYEGSGPLARPFDFRVMDVRRPGEDVAVCADRDNAEKIVAALNAAEPDDGADG